MLFFLASLIFSHFFSSSSLARSRFDFSLSFVLLIVRRQASPNQRMHMKRDDSFLLAQLRLVVD